MRALAPRNGHWHGPVNFCWGVTDPPRAHAGRCRGRSARPWRSPWPSPCSSARLVRHRLSCVNPANRPARCCRRRASAANTAEADWCHSISLITAAHAAASSEDGAANRELLQTTTAALGGGGGSGTFVTAMGLKIPAGDTAMIEMMRSTEKLAAKMDAAMAVMAQRGYTVSQEDSMVPRLAAASAKAPAVSVANAATIRRTPPTRSSA